MKRLLQALLVLGVVALLAICTTKPVVAAGGETPGLVDIHAGCLGLAITGWSGEPGDMAPSAPQNSIKFNCGSTDEEGKSSGLLPSASQHIARLYEFQPSSQEYFADILNNMGVPSVSKAYAQGTGYKALSPFLPFWKTFRNLAYSLYIIMFVVVGIMIMLRTKVSAQAVITIQAALPNLLVTLILITFSYAIVGFMIDLMYFLMYFASFLFSSLGILDGNKTIDRLMSHSAWGVVFSGRNGIISVVSETIRQILGANSLPGTITRIVAGVATVGISEVFVQAIPYLLAAVWLAITMLKLVFLLTKSYLMLIIQTVTSPVQILMNALPGSKAFTEWLKKTASYIIPFPIAAVMFIISAILIGNPTNSTKLKSFDPRDANPFGINENHDFYQGWQDNSVWVPPFTFDLGWESWDIMIIMGFFVLTMTPAAVKMAQDWLQVKESPYASEIFGGLGTAYGLYEWAEKQKQKRQSEDLYKKQVEYYSNKAGQA